VRVSSLEKQNLISGAIMTERIMQSTICNHDRNTAGNIPLCVFGPGGDFNKVYTPQDTCKQSEQHRQSGGNSIVDLLSSIAIIITQALPMTGESRGNA